MWQCGSQRSTTGMTCRHKRLCRPNGDGRHGVRRYIEELICVRGVWRGVFRKGKVVLVKGDVPRDDDLVGRQVKTAISFMMSRITKEDT
jgi:hypothetical protein